jgi:hypothetical protein
MSVAHVTALRGTRAAAISAATDTAAPPSPAFAAADNSALYTTYRSSGRAAGEGGEPAEGRGATDQRGHSLLPRRQCPHREVYATFWGGAAVGR